MRLVDLLTTLDHIIYQKVTSSVITDALKAANYNTSKPVLVVDTLITSFGSTHKLDMCRYIKPYFNVVTVNNVQTLVPNELEFKTLERMVPSIKLIVADTTVIIIEFKYEGKTYLIVDDPLASYPELVGDMVF